MPLKIFRFKHLKDHTNPREYDPFTSVFKNHGFGSHNGSSDKICPVYLLPLLIAAIFVFTVAQILMIHRTIESYKLRDQAYRDCYYPTESGLQKNTTATGNLTSPVVITARNKSNPNEKTRIQENNVIFQPWSWNSTMKLKSLFSPRAT